MAIGFAGFLLLKTQGTSTCALSPLLAALLHAQKLSKSDVNT
jgi:hypothetical protein